MGFTKKKSISLPDRNNVPLNTELLVPIVKIDVLHYIIGEIISTGVQTGELGI